MKISEYPSKLVINAQLDPDSLISGNISRSLAILDESNSYFVYGAKVNLFENDILVDTPVVQLFGSFKSNLVKPKPGFDYKIEAKANNYLTASGESRVPDNNIVYTIDTLTEMRTRINSNPALQFIISLSIQDKPNEENFYIVSVTASFTYKIVNFNPMDPSMKPLDSTSRDTTILSTYEVETNSTIPEMINTFAMRDEFEIVDRSGGIGLSANQDNYIRSHKFAFSDVTFNGKKATIDFETGPYVYEDTLKLKIALRSVSKDYYTYLKSMAIYRNAGGFFAEKVQIFNNIKNGYGILGSECKVEKEVARIRNSTALTYKYKH